MPSSWEDSISLGNSAAFGPRQIGQVADFVEMDAGEVDWRKHFSDPERMIAADTAPLPSTEDREGYYGANHFNYWASGLSDYKAILDWTKNNGIEFRDYLDFGCASGRLIRHVAAQSPGVNVFGCDINRQHVDWCNAYMPDGVMVFQNTSLPQLPLADSSLDVVSAFSVFTHIESFDTAWMMEFRRVLRPGGIAWITIHGDRTWTDIDPTWPLYEPLTQHPDYAAYRGQTAIPGDRLAFRWIADASYSANVFYSYAHVRKHWGRYFAIDDIFPATPPFQDIVVMRRT